MSKKEIVVVLSISVVGIILSLALIFLASIWFGILLLYFGLHMTYGPLDWYLIYKLYKGLTKSGGDS